MSDDEIPIRNDGEWAFKACDYAISHGRAFKIEHNKFTGGVVAREVDEIPAEYWERYDD